MQYKPNWYFKNAWTIFHGQENEWGIGIKKRSKEQNNCASNCQWEVAAWRRSRIITMTMKTNTLLMMMMTTTKYVHMYVCSMFMTLLPPLPLGHSLSYINYLTNSSKIVQLHLLPHFFGRCRVYPHLLLSSLLLLFIFYFAHKYGKHYIFLM